MKKDKILKILMQEFRKKGYSAGTLGNLSQATGLGKSSLYHHFPAGKEQMALEIIAFARSWIRENLLVELDSKKSPAEKMKAVLDKLSIFYSHGEIGCLIDAMSLEDSIESLSIEIKHLTQDLVNIFEMIFLENGQQENKAKKNAMETLILIQGSLILSRAMQSPAVFKEKIYELQL